MAVKLIVGLGNPGPRYLWTRHNAGFIVLDRFANLAGIPVTRKSFGGLYGEGDFKGNRLTGTSRSPGGRRCCARAARTAGCSSPSTSLS